VSANDADTGNSVTAAVLLDGSQIGQTNTAFTHTFQLNTEKVWDPGDQHTKGHWTVRIKPNRLVVRASGYRDATVELTVI
jgi:hypothetical protein